MNDKEFAQLKDDIEDAMDHLESLQQKYSDETGQNFIRPLRLAPRKTARKLAPVVDVVWVIHEIETDRYDETVKFYGVATSEEERDRISGGNPNADVTEIEADTDHAGIYGASNFREAPSW